MKIKWSSMLDAGICASGVEEAKIKFGGDGITLAQARKACLTGKLSLSNCARVAAALNLPRWKLALGRCVAMVHPLAKPYYTDAKMYVKNQRHLQRGDLGKIDRAAAADAAYAASAAAADAAYAAYAADAAAYAAYAADAAYFAAHYAYYAAGINCTNVINAFFDALGAK